jgi:aryl-alcohol dehydrogenase-like predicted oxidoreductase
VTPKGIEAGMHFSELAHQFGKLPGQLGLLWCKDQPGITAPIYGPRTLEQLQQLLPVLEMQLSEEECLACEQVNPPGSWLVNFHNTSGWLKTPSVL